METRSEKNGFGTFRVEQAGDWYGQTDRLEESLSDWTRYVGFVPEYQL